MFTDLQNRELGAVSRLHHAAHATRTRLSLWARMGLDSVLRSHRGCVNHVFFNQNGSLLCAGSDDTRLSVWDITQMKQRVFHATGHVRNIFCCKFLPCTGDSLIATCAADGDVRVHDVSTGNIEKFSHHSAPAKKLVLEPESPYIIISCSEDGTVQQVDRRQPGSQMLLKLRRFGMEQEINSISSPCYKPWLMAVGASDDVLRVYDRRICPGSSGATGRGAVRMKCIQRSRPSGALQEADFITGVCFADDGTEVLANYLGEHVYLIPVGTEHGAIENMCTPTQVSQRKLRRNQQSQQAAQRLQQQQQPLAKDLGVPGEVADSQTVVPSEQGAVVCSGSGQGIDPSQKDSGPCKPGVSASSVGGREQGRSLTWEHCINPCQQSLDLSQQNLVTGQRDGLCPCHANIASSQQKGSASPPAASASAVGPSQPAAADLGKDAVADLGQSAAVDQGQAGVIGCGQVKIDSGQRGATQAEVKEDNQQLGGIVESGDVAVSPADTSARQALLEAGGKLSEENLDAIVALLEAHQFSLPRLQRRTLLDRLLERGEELLQDDNAEAAMGFARCAVRLAPNLGLAHYQMAQCYETLGRFPDALHQAEVAMQSAWSYDMQRMINRLRRRMQQQSQQPQPPTLPHLPLQQQPPQQPHQQPLQQPAQQPHQLQQQLPPQQLLRAQQPPAPQPLQLLQQPPPPQLSLQSLRQQPQPQTQQQAQKQNKPQQQQQPSIAQTWREVEQQSTRPHPQPLEWQQEQHMSDQHLHTDQLVARERAGSHKGSGRHRDTSSMQIDRTDVGADTDLENHLEETRVDNAECGDKTSRGVKLQERTMHDAVRDDAARNSAQRDATIEHDARDYTLRDYVRNIEALNSGDIRDDTAIRLVARDDARSDKRKLDRTTEDKERYHMASDDIVRGSTSNARSPRDATIHVHFQPGRSHAAAVTETLPSATEPLSSVTQTLPTPADSLPNATQTVPSVTEALPAAGWSPDQALPASNSHDIWPTYRISNNDISSEPFSVELSSDDSLSGESSDDDSDVADGSDCASSDDSLSDNLSSDASSSHASKQPPAGRRRAGCIAARVDLIDLEAISESTGRHSNSGSGSRSRSSSNSGSGSGAGAGASEQLESSSTSWLGSLRSSTSSGSSSLSSMHDMSDWDDMWSNEELFADYDWGADRQDAESAEDEGETQMGDDYWSRVQLGRVLMAGSRGPETLPGPEPSPSTGWTTRYMGACNMRTVKDVAFVGRQQECVAAGSACGRLFIWERLTGRLLVALKADQQVVNCIQSHPNLPMLASCGIDSSIKIWTPCRHPVNWQSDRMAVTVAMNEMRRHADRRQSHDPSVFSHMHASMLLARYEVGNGGAGASTNSARGKIA